MERLKVAVIHQALKMGMLPEAQHAKAKRYLMRAQARASGLNANIVMATGQMRSGTTMLAAFLGNQPGIRVIPDALRVPVASMNYFKTEVDPENPLTSEDCTRLYMSLARTALRNQFSTAEEKALFNRWEEKKEIPEFLNQVELYLLLAREMRSDLGATGYFGTKATRGEALARSLAEYGGKAIILLRDPRAVYTSHAKRAEKDANFHASEVDQFIKNWRHSYTIWKSPGRAHSLRYEDFVNGNAEIERLGKYLGLKLDPNARITTANSSFGDKSTGARRPHVVDRWRTEGDPDAIAQIERELAAEMRDAGY